jgi:6-phospho-beta-glucosidase
MKRYKGKVRYYLTFNEINATGIIPFMSAGVIHYDDQILAQAAHNQFVASAKTVKAAHEIDPQIKVGQMLAFKPIYPLTSHPADQVEVMNRKHQTLFYSDVQTGGHYPSYKLQEYKRKGIQLDDTPEDYQLIEKYSADFLSFSCYTSQTVSANQEKPNIPGGEHLGVKNPYLEVNEWGWATDPSCLRLALNELYERYHKPLWIVENGLGYDDKLVDGIVHDDYRIDYLRQNIQSMKEAVELDGVELMGYTTWGCIDLVALGTGEMHKRYGFIYVDADDHGNGSMKRYKKDSFDWYKKVIASNGENLE